MIKHRDVGEAMVDMFNSDLRRDIRLQKDQQFDHEPGREHRDCLDLFHCVDAVFNSSHFTGISGRWIDSTSTTLIVTSGSGPAVRRD